CAPSVRVRTAGARPPRLFHPPARRGGDGPNPRLAGRTIIPLGLRHVVPRILWLRRIVALARDHATRKARGVPVQVLIGAIQLQPIQVLHYPERIAPAAIAFLERLER